MARTLDDGTRTLYGEISDYAGFDKSEDESAEDYKGRLVLEFSDMDRWPDETYDRLPQHIKSWIFDATTEYKANRTRKKPRNLPPMAGLDVQHRRRADLSPEPPTVSKGRSKTGDDCLTRVVRELMVKPDIDTTTLRDMIKEKHGKEYSKAAVRYAMTAYQTVVREILTNPEALRKEFPSQYAPLPNSGHQPQPQSQAA